MKAKTTLFILVLAAGLVGCGRQQPRQIVILPDVSGSIERESLEQAFKAIDEMVGHLHRGDRIAIIPILGDAQAEASGRIIRFEIPSSRQAYDSDLRNFRATLTKSLDAMQADAAAHPGSKTDILGSLELAQQELRLSVAHSKLLVILSDFIQEDRTVDFRSDKRLANISAAKKFVSELRARPRLDHVAVYLGLLRSKEYAALDRSRRNAIREVWIEYLKTAKAQPEFAIDGPGLLKSAQHWE
jgi:hypothetical protein